MKKTFIYPVMSLVLVLIAVLLKPGIANAQEKQDVAKIIELRQGITETDLIATAARVTPSWRQLNWQRLEATAFIHFGMNTFYNQEWGKGTEDPARFNPTQLNTDQWAKEISEAGLKMLIMTCKHHDGFCLWPSKYTNHTVAASPWMHGSGDLVKMVSASCHKYNLKFGVYLSPWDRHEPSYGNSDVYNQFFLNQLTELLSNYGTVDEVWFDGACAEGPNGKKQVYDWNSYYQLIRRLQPAAVISIMGPDIRWVGTESGYGRETEWSVVPYSLAAQDKIAAESQQAEMKAGFIPPGDLMNQDLGSREKIKGAQSLIWYPSEVDVSIRPGWFWHGNENAEVKSAEKLLDIYFSSVGRNSLLLLNIPPDTTGLINQADIKSLKAWRNALNDIFSKNMAKNATVYTDGPKPDIKTITDQNDTTSWTPAKTGSMNIELKLQKTCDFNILLLQENITKGQRIEQFTLEAWVDKKWKKITEGTTVGYKRILRFPDVKTDKVRLMINQSRLEPALAEFGLYYYAEMAPSGGSQEK